MSSTVSPLLEMRSISKSFPGVRALQDVSVEVLAGEVHALVGENGAGKSTLMNIVSGVLQPDSGRMEWVGNPLAVRNPRAAQDLGISFVHQELALVPQLTIAENVFLGRHPSRQIGLPMVKWGELRARSRELLAELGHDVDPRTLVQQSSIGEQQLVE